MRSLNRHRFVVPLLCLNSYLGLGLAANRGWRPRSGEAIVDTYLYHRRTGLWPCRAGLKTPSLDMPCGQSSTRLAVPNHRNIAEGV
jgi:hypothetical protein